MAQPILPIIDSDFPGPAAKTAMDLRVQMALANDESTLGHFGEAARLRNETLTIYGISAVDRQLVIEELVRDFHCLNQPEQALVWAEQLDPPVRSIYLGSGQVDPKSIDLSKHSHRLFYLALRTTHPKRRRKILSRFLSQQKQLPTRSWEVHEGRKLATELCRGQGEPFCTMCCRMQSEVRLIAWSNQCVDCLKLATQWLVMDQMNVTDVAPISKFLGTRFPEESRRAREAALPPIVWSEEATNYLARAKELGSAPWTTMDLLAVLEPAGIPYGRLDEPVADDGLHSKGWLKVLETAEWLARWWYYRPGTVTAHHLSLALCWSEFGQAGKILQLGQWRQKMSFRFYIRLTPSEVRRLDSELRSSPSDTFLRAALMVAYGAPSNGLSDTRCRREYKKHALWILDNCPEHPAALDIWLSFGPEAAEISRKVLHLLVQYPGNLYIKEMAAKLFHHDKPELALAILNETGLDSKRALVRSELCRKVGDWQKALFFAHESLAMGGSKDDGLAHAVSALIGMKDWSRLETEAQKLVESGDNNAEFGREAIALAALHQGRGAEAEAYLLDTGAARRWPVSLMRGFLEVERPGPVLDYLSGRLASRRGKQNRYIREAIRSIGMGKPVDWFMLSYY